MFIQLPLSNHVKFNAMTIDIISNLKLLKIAKVLIFKVFLQRLKSYF